MNERIKELAHSEQEPVVFYRCTGCGHAYEEIAPSSCDCTEGAGFQRVNYYTAPPKKEWVGLTADEIWKCNKAEPGSAVEFHICSAHQNVLDFAEAIESKLKEKNS